MKKTTLNFSVSSREDLSFKKPIDIEKQAAKISAKQSVLNSLVSLKNSSKISSVNKYNSTENSLKETPASTVQQMVNYNIQDHVFQSNLAALTHNSSFDFSKEEVGALDLRIPVIKLNEVQYLGKIGKGSWGEALKGKWQDLIVARKKIKMDNHKMLLREISVMEKLKHPNVIEIWAVAFDSMFCHLILQYFDGDDLRIAIFVTRE